MEDGRLDGVLKNNSLGAGIQIQAPVLPHNPVAVGQFFFPCSCARVGNLSLPQPSFSTILKTCKNLNTSQFTLQFKIPLLKKLSSHSPAQYLSVHKNRKHISNKASNQLVQCPITTD